MRRLALILLCALSLSASARPFGGTTSGSGGETLLAYLEGAGASTYVLSGQFIDDYSNTPLDTFDFGTGTWGTSTATFPVTIAAPGSATGLTPAIFQMQVISGCGWGGTINQANCGYIQPMYNAEPNAWDQLGANAQAHGMLVYVQLMFWNPAGSGVCPWPDVLSSGNGTYTAFMSGLDAIAASMKTSLTKPFMLATLVEANLGGTASNLTSYNGWVGINACSTGTPSTTQDAQLAAQIQQELIKDGVTNFLDVFQMNANYSSTGSYGFGFPCAQNTSIANACATTVTNTVFDVVAGDNDNNFYDPYMYDFMQSTGLPMGYGNAQMCQGSCASSENAYSQGYSGGTCPEPSGSVGFGAQCIAIEYPGFGFMSWWGQDGWTNSLNTLTGATQAMTTFPFISASSLPASFSKAGGQAGD